MRYLVARLIILSTLVCAVGFASMDSAHALKVHKWVNWKNADTIHKVIKCRADRNKCCEAVGGQPQEFMVHRIVRVTKTKPVKVCGLFNFIFGCHVEMHHYTTAVDFPSREWRCIKGHAYFTTDGPGGSLVASLSTLRP